MTTDRITSLKKLLERSPDDPRLLFGLALEHEKQGAWAEAAELLQRYLGVAEDEGNAWGRLGRALRELGRDDQARAAYHRGVEASLRHGHPSMAQEFETVLKEWD